MDATVINLQFHGGNYIHTSALRLLALRGWRTLCVRRRHSAHLNILIWNLRYINVYNNNNNYSNRCHSKKHQICQYLMRVAEAPKEPSMGGVWAGDILQTNYVEWITQSTVIKVPTPEIQ